MMARSVHKRDPGRFNLIDPTMTDYQLIKWLERKKRLLISILLFTMTAVAVLIVLINEFRQLLSIIRGPH